MASTLPKSIFLISLVLVFLTASNRQIAAQQAYKVTLLNPSSSGLNLTAFGINNSGQVIAYGGKVYVYSGGSWTVIAPDGLPYDINNIGQVAITEIHPQEHALLYRAGGLFQLGELQGGSSSEAHALNDTGTVVGSSDVTVVRSDGTTFNTFHPVIWQLGASPIDLFNGKEFNLFGGREGEALGINNLNQVVGRAADNRGNDRGFIFSNGNFIKLPQDANLPTMFPTFINEAGQVAGDLHSNPSAIVRSFLWSNGNISVLDSLGGDTVYTLGFNNSGQVVGTSYLADNQTRHAFIYTGGVVHDLNDLLLPGCFCVLTDANGINDSGQIVASGYTTGSGFVLNRVFLLTPMTAPPADLSITKTASAAQVKAGDNITYSIKVTNHGPEAASFVTVTDNLPAQVTYVTCSTTGGVICAGSGNNLTFLFPPSLANGATATITIFAKVNNQIADGTVISNTASVSPTITDPNLSDNSSTAGITVQSACTPPSINTQPNNQTISAGQTATLNVVASGTSLLTYQWYEGDSGDTTKPVGINSSSFTTPTLSTSTKYWVRVSNSCGSVNSNAATITVCALTVNSIPEFTIPPSWTQFNLDGSTTFHPSTKTFYLLVKDSCTQQPISNATVEFNYEAVEHSGGHLHSDPLRPRGFFERAEGPAPPDGSILFAYTSPEVAGQIDVNFVVTAQDGRTFTSPVSRINVKVDGLVAMAASADYDLVGSTLIHPNNHYVESGFDQALINIAKNYASNSLGGKLQYNDMSLIYGGRFDLNGDWFNPHKGHMFGRNADLCMITGGSCTRPVAADTRLTLLGLIKAQNTGVLVEKPPLAERYHWHLKYGEPGCAILGSPGVDCNKDNIGPNNRALLAPAATSDVQVQATTLVTYDPVTKLYTYQYTFRNDPVSSLQVSSVQIPLSGLSAVNLHAPRGWTASLWHDSAAVDFTATEIDTLPPNYVDDGNILPSPYQIKQGQTLGGFSFQSPYPPGTVKLLAQGFKPLPTLSSDDNAQQPSMFDGSYVGTTTGPVLGGPILVSEETSTRAIALESPSWLRDPFRLNSPVPWGPDQRTRVMLFAMNFDLLPGENSSIATADAEDASHNIYPLTVEYVGKVPGYGWLNCVVVRLNDNMGDIGDVLVRLTVRGISSNRVRLAIGHIGEGPPDDPGALPTPGRQP